MFRGKREKQTKMKGRERKKGTFTKRGSKERDKERG